MPYYLRAIYSNLSWDKTQFPQWLKEDDLPSCVVKDLSADSNKLSLWEITDDKTNLMQVITAIASGRKTLKDNFDYALLPVRYIDSMYFTYSKKKGKTPYTAVNSCHCDLSNVSLQNLIYFAHLLYKYAKFDRVGWKDVQASVLDAANSNKLNLKQLRDELKEELGIQSDIPLIPYF